MMLKCGIIIYLMDPFKSPHELLDVFFAKIFSCSMQHDALQRIFNFRQLKDETSP